MKQDVAAADVGIRNCLPSYRHVVFARNALEEADLRSLFRSQFGIELEKHYTATLIGERLGVTVLSFSEGYGKVMSSENAVEAKSLVAAKAEMHEIQLPTRQQPNRG